MPFIPSSLREAASHLRFGWQNPPEKFSREEFLVVWASVAYLYPGLHPDGFDSDDSGWPRILKRLAAEAWRRVEAGEITEEELYPSDAQWAGIYDRMAVHTPDKIARRRSLHSPSTHRPMHKINAAKRE